MTVTTIRPSAERPRDDFERALLETRALIEETMTRHRERAGRPEPVSTLDLSEVALPEAARSLYAQATTSVDVILGGDRAHAERICAALASAAVPGPRVRILAGAGAAGVVPEATGDWAPQTRTARVPAVEAVLVDGARALIRPGLDAAGRATVLRAAPVVTAFHTLFQQVWQQAVPPAAQLDLGDRVRTRFAVEIVRRLCAGRTDEAVARELSVSVRTYRRHVAEIMEALGARSRFQAGVRAAELGLCSFAVGVSKPDVLPQS